MNLSSPATNWSCFAIPSAVCFSDEPPAKRQKTVVVTTTADGSIDQEALRAQLEEMRREAEEYKQQLREKEQEAEGYKKQLDQMTSKTS